MSDLAGSAGNAAEAQDAVTAKTASNVVSAPGFTSNVATNEARATAPEEAAYQHVGLHIGGIVAQQARATPEAKTT